MSERHYTDSAVPPLAGRLALVTGGARRLGGAISSHLGRLGARVAVHYNSSAAAAEGLVASLAAGGFAVRADLSRADGVGSLFSQLEGLGESPDLVVHAAAGFVRGSLQESDSRLWGEVLSLNLVSFALIARELERTRGTRGGELIAIADAAAIELWPGYLAHSVAKAGLISLVKALAKALAPAYRVNAVAPGAVLPPEETSPEELALFRRRTLLQRLGDPSDVTRAVEFLALSPFVTGSIVRVTGGSELWRGSA